MKIIYYKFIGRVCSYCECKIMPCWPVQANPYCECKIIILCISTKVLGPGQCRAAGGRDLAQASAGLLAAAERET
jgi:hypothetical protein